LSRATTVAEADGQTTVGLSHFFDYLESFRAGRIRVDAVPALTRPAPALLSVDANGGLAHLAVDLAFEPHVTAAKQFGIALLAIRNAYTCGSLGYFAGRIAERGLVAIAAANGPPMLAGSGARQAVFGTNPLAFAAPAIDGDILLIDQASSATAFVNVRQAAERGETLPPGWGINAAGEPTVDPVEAMKGALLAFGGSRGANIALMVEVLSAGLTSANWSLDSPSFSEGSASPGVGLLIIGIDPDLLDPNFKARLSSQITRLERLGVYIPGRSRPTRRAEAWRSGVVVPRVLRDALLAAAGSLNPANVGR
jgi:(2R)-3-sulfolactate dehydrogenase (NADP+)